MTTGTDLHEPATPPVPPVPPPPIPPVIATYLRALLDYNWAAEEADYAEQPSDLHVFGPMRALREWLGDTNPPPGPDIGDRFDRNGQDCTVTAWVKRNPAPTPASARLGPDDCALVFCSREEAEYVVTSNDIVRVAEVTVTAWADWPQEVFDNLHRRVADARGQELV